MQTSICRFVLLMHDWPHQHCDLMLESNGKLLTWRLPAEIFDLPEWAAEPLPPHRLHYLKYEGELSGGRGTVRRIDAGEMTWLSETRFSLRGEKLAGEFEIGETVIRRLP